MPQCSAAPCRTAALGRPCLQPERSGRGRSACVSRGVTTDRPDLERPGAKDQSAPIISTGARCPSASIAPDAAGASVLTVNVSDALPRRRRDGHESSVIISQLCCHKGSIVTKEEEYRGNPHKMWIATIFFLFGAYKSKSYMPHRASFLPQLPMKHSSPPGASACYGSLAARR